MKICLAKIIRCILFLFPSFFIKKNKVLFVSYSGAKFTCNPATIYKKLINSNKKYECIIVKNNNDDKNTKSITVKYKNIKFYYQYMTSKILITNDAFPLFLPKLKKQVLINTWHGGGAYKKVDPITEQQVQEYNLLYRDIDYFISSNRKFSQVMSHALNIEKNKFLNIGMPRNDIFFDKNLIQKEQKKIKKEYSLDNEILILYAPTWRDDGRNIVENLTDIHILEALRRKFNKKVKFMLRAHYHTKLLKSEAMIDVSDYPDMQELLCAADILITDYSSCMWDFSLMYKPCFIFATDIDKYKQERDFYTPMSKWPFPIASNNEELVNNILNFNEAEYIEKVKKHHKALGSYEDGHACERVCKLIEEICKAAI